MSIYDNAAHQFVKSAALLFESLYEAEPSTPEFRRFMAVIEEYAQLAIHPWDMLSHIAGIEELLAACHDMSEYERGNNPDAVHQELDEEIDSCVRQII